MAEQAKDYTGVLIFGGVAAGLYFLYNYLSSSCPGQTTGLCSIYNYIFGTSVAATPAAVAAASVSSPAPTTQAAPPASTTPLPAAPSPASQVLTAQDADTLAYVASISAAQMQAISAQVDQELQAGQIAQIAGGSVLAYMLGWGGGTKGNSKSVYGLTYNYDGTNWNLQASGGGSNTTANLVANGAGNCPAGYMNPTGQPGAPCVAAQSIAGLGTIMNNPGTDLYTGFYFSNGSAGPDPVGMGAIADGAFGHSRVPRHMVHGGPGFNMRRAS